MSLYIDVTEFLWSLRRTGIERINGEICRCLPPNSAIPVRFHVDRYVTLPPDLIGMVGQYFGSGGESEAREIRKLAAEAGRAIEISPSDRFLVPEIFGHERADYFRRMRDQDLQRCRFIIYDLLPLTHPEYFLPEMPHIMSEYFYIMRRASHCGFISEYTRETFYRRLKRASAREGVVLPLGCDSLGQRPRQPILNRPLTFSVIGTIEPRKNHAVILEAFEPLLREIEGLTLSFVGKMGWVDSGFDQKVASLASDKISGFQFLSAPDDRTIRRVIEQSRAMIYVSAAEGYGLPPVEGLWLGTPVIASAAIPSLRSLGSAGILHVEPLNAENLREAVLAFIDDGYANRKAEEAYRLDLPTWQSFTQRVLKWCNEDAE